MPDSTGRRDPRSPQRRAQDEQIASEPQLEKPELPPGTATSPVETHLARLHRPVAIAGVVENGLARPLDLDRKLPEGARVIIVASEAN